MDFRDAGWVIEYLGFKFSDRDAFHVYHNKIRLGDLHLVEATSLRGLPLRYIHVIDRTTRQWISVRLHNCPDIEAALHLFCTIPPP
ncbi:MAG: hypothetical protein JWO15_3609 [Sphingomonadales bacterium]|nr:hypothetical protein [Sphingomonadales bacterium]